ncbi:type I methionyl aminopeptidase [Ferviditalea candida]|uniref:Methionine aminopeptidase n=1 Tax=Ferviditalea candida TaxID=3108399 RepID=A0ABU5ZLJ3_9BACL|nr:type I methionyl aminopeptidase [Paenibacillaceae bacterium T2]
MIVDSPKDIEGLKKIGRVVALTIKEMKERARPGMTTQELDEIGERVLNKHGASSAPQKMYNFPGATCISLNHEAAHGVPGNRKIRKGDVLNIDVSAELNGYFADAGHSFQIPPYNPQIVKLCRFTHQTMMKVISQLKHGVKLNLIGQIIETEAGGAGYGVIKNLCSHGVGRSLHEEPFQILHVYNPNEETLLQEGQVITVEPFLTTGAEYVLEQPDGWTLRVPDESYVAQQEHTVIITRNEPMIVTAI